MFLFLLLNLSLLFGLVAAPSALLLTIAYRKRIGQVVFSWNRPEMVLLTIVFSVVALLHLIIGVSCLFSYWGYLEPAALAHLDRSQYFYVGMVCLSNILGIVLFYFAARLLLVHLVVEDGIILNRVLFPGLLRLKLLHWEDLADYYHVPDYPNTVFTFIHRTSELKYARHTVRVPIYLKDDFITYIESRMGNDRFSQHDSEMSSSFFPESEG